MSDRPTIRCAACRLNQFMTASGDCRRCRLPLVKPVSGACDFEPNLVHTSTEEHSNYEGMLQPVGYLIGSRLRAVRESMRFSQIEAALLSEVSQPWISRMEQGRTDPQIGTLEKYTEALRVPLCILLGTSEAFDEFLLHQEQK